MFHSISVEQNLCWPLVVDLVDLLDSFDKGRLQSIYEPLMTTLEASGAEPAPHGSVSDGHDSGDTLVSPGWVVINVDSKSNDNSD